METTIKTDVVIVGAGPTGLLLACQLIRYNVDFVIIDKKDGVTAYSKALGVHARTLEIYEQIGIAERAVAQGTIAGKMRLLEGGEVRGEVDLSSVGQGLSRYPFMLVLEQSKNERLLYEYVRAHGKDVLWRATLESFSQTDEAVTAQIKTSGGETQIVEAKYLVGCDGPKSPTRRGLGLAFEGSTFERIFYVADVEIDWKFSHDALQVCWRKTRSSHFSRCRAPIVTASSARFPKNLPKTRAKCFTKKSNSASEKKPKSSLKLRMSTGFQLTKSTRAASKISPKADVFDAAHVHTPAGGQGMNTGIGDAYNLAWKLAFVLQGKADAKILETYNAERLENAENLLATTDRMFNLVAGTDWLVNIIRTTVFPPMAKYILGIDAVKKRFFPLISQIGINYRRHALSRHDGDENFAVKAGDRMPYFLDGGASIYDRLREPKFHLVAFSDGTSDYQSIKGEIENDYKNLIDFSVVPLYPRVAEIFGTDEPFALLLRPDNYVSFVSRAASLNDLRDYLNEVIN